MLATLPPDERPPDVLGMARVMKLMALACRARTGGCRMTSHRAPSRRAQEFPMTAEQLLEQAASVVRDRRHTYGQPRDLFERVASSLVSGARDRR